MEKYSKQDYDTVIEAIYYEYKNNPIKLNPTPTIINMAPSFASQKDREGVHIRLNINNHVELKDIPLEYIRDIICELELMDKILRNYSPRTFIEPKKRFTIPHYKQNDPLNYNLVIYDSFENWHNAHLIRKNQKLEKLTKNNFNNLYAMVFDMGERLQINPSPQITVPLVTKRCINFLENSHAEDIIRSRTDVLNYLEQNKLINYYKIDYFAGKQNPDILIDLNIKEFLEFSQQLATIYLKKQTNKDKSHPPISLPADTKWEQVTIKFLNGNDVTIQAKEVKIQSDFKEMGFCDKKKNVPNKQWEFLRALSEHHGEINWDSSEATTKLKKRKQLLSSALKNCFHIDEDPFYPYKKEKTYKIKLILLPE